MLEKPIASHVVGLELDGSSLKGAAVNLSRGRLRIESLFETTISSSTAEDGDVKPLYTNDEELEKYSEKYLIASTLPANDILIRTLDLKLKKEKDIDATLPFQVEPILPYPVENAIIDRIIQAKEKEGTKLTIVSVRKDHLSKSLAEWNGIGIEPEVLTAPPQALVLFANQFAGTETPLYILNIGITRSFGLLADNGKLIAAQAFDGGLEGLISAREGSKQADSRDAMEELKKINLLSAPLSAESVWKAPVDALRMDVTRTVYSLGKQTRGKDVKEILLTGPGAAIEGLPELICQSLGKAHVSLNLESVPGIDNKELLAYAVPIGAALSALPSSRDQINFRQNEFAYPEPWKRLKEPLLLYFLLTLAFAVALYLFGSAYSSYRQGEVKQEYLNLLDTMNKPYTQFENEFIAKTAGQRVSGEEVPATVESLTNEDIERRLSFLEKEIQATPHIFPLQPNVPLVSDVLAWISTHPNFVGSKDKNAPGAQTLQIENFSYTMVKRPEPTKKQEKYQVKVELEFSSPTPKMAREFHDALIAPNDIVDQKSEIKWTSNRDKYKTSFYLKDKTQYPTP